MEKGKTWKIEIEYNGSGSLNLRDTPITSLPEGLHVGGDLYLRDTPIEGKYEVVNKRVVKLKEE